MTHQGPRARRDRRNAVLALSIVIPLALPAAIGAAQTPTYPQTRRVDVVDTLHGVAVPDPYRWLEDLNSAETGAWIDAQNALTQRFLGGLAGRTRLRERLTALWNYPRVTLPTRLANGVLFYRGNSGLQKQFVVFARSSPSTPPKAIIDPNVISPDGSVALAQFEPAPDGRHVAYALAQGGADWQDVKIRAVRTGVDLPETIRWVRFSGLSWTKDGKGFFYSRYPESDEKSRLIAALEHQKIYYHRIGTEQSSDVLVYERPDLPDWFVSGGVTEDGQYLVVYMSEGADSRNRLYVADLGDPKAPDVSAAIRPLVEQDDGEYLVIGNVGSTWRWIWRGRNGRRGARSSPRARTRSTTRR